MPAALQAAIAVGVQDQVDANARGDNQADERTALAVQVFGEAPIDVIVERDADVVAGVAEGPLEVERIDAAHATIGAGSERRACSSMAGRCQRRTAARTWAAAVIVDAAGLLPELASDGLKVGRGDVDNRPAEATVLASLARAADRPQRRAIASNYMVRAVVSAWADEGQRRSAGRLENGHCGPPAGYADTQAENRFFLRS